MAETTTSQEIPISPTTEKQSAKKSTGMPAAILGKLSSIADGEEMKMKAMDAALSLSEAALPAMEKLRDRSDAVEKRMNILNMSDSEREELREKQRIEKLNKTSEGRKILEAEEQAKAQAEQKKEEEIAKMMKKVFGEDYLKTMKITEAKGPAEKVLAAYKPKTEEEHRQDIEGTVNWAHKMNNLSKEQSAFPQQQNPSPREPVKV
jgi:hypothetical protein